jgi:hypothetical protein
MKQNVSNWWWGSDKAWRPSAMMEDEAKDGEYQEVTVIFAQGFFYMF